MGDRGVHSDRSETASDPAPVVEHVKVQWQEGRPFVVLAGAFMLGLALGALWPRPWAWLAIALPLLLIVGVLAWRGRSRAAAHWSLLAVVTVGAGWGTAGDLGADHVARYVRDEPQLAEVTGTVVDEPRLRTPDRGAFGRFSYMSPRTLFTLKVDSIVRRGERVDASGKLLVRINAADHRIRKGRRIGAVGWLGRVEPPRNPGEFDYRAWLADEGVHGRLFLVSRGNWRPIGSAGWGHPVAALRRVIGDSAQAALRLGMVRHATPAETSETAHPRPASDAAGQEAQAPAGPRDAQRKQRRRLALLEAMLLGRRTAEASELYEAFQQVGLAHLMAISGAHLGILLGLVWLVVRGLVPYPPRAALVVLVVLGLYLMAVPLRVPIVRAGIMAGLFCAAYGTGRRVSPLGLLSLAAVIVLLWRPMDLFRPGFQLSFGVVAGLILFARPAAQWHWMWPPFGGMQRPSVWWRAAAWLWKYVAATLVACLIALPLVAYHFELMNPLAVLFSVLALPVVTGLLGVGYLKMLLGAALPSVSMLLAWPLAGLTDLLLYLVEQAGRWPGAAVELSRPPSAAWVVAVLMVVVGLFSGAFARRKWALGACAAVLALWTLAIERPDMTAALTGRADRAALCVNVFSVGDGSCYLVRAGSRTFMFDCGSQAYLDVGERSIVPALRRLGVRRIDVLFLSHPDIDHYCGALAVMDAVAVDQVRVPPQLLHAAADRPDSAVGYLVEQLRQRGARLVPTSRGWSQPFGETQLEALWPPRDLRAERVNDTSLVLSVRRDGRRVLFSGDIDETAMAGLLQRDADLRADVVELPHHGSFNARSPAWLDATSPRVVLESSGPRRQRRDGWANVLRSRAIERLVTDELGMIELTLERDTPTIRWRAFRQPGLEGVVERLD